MMCHTVHKVLSPLHNKVTFEVEGEERLGGSEIGGDRTDDSAEEGKMGGLLAEEAEPIVGLVTPVRPIGLVGLVRRAAADAAALAVLRVSLLALHLSTSGSDMSWNRICKVSMLSMVQSLCWDTSHQSLLYIIRDCCSTKQGR